MEFRFSDQVSVFYYWNIVLELWFYIIHNIKSNFKLWSREFFFSKTYVFKFVISKSFVMFDHIFTTPNPITTDKLAQMLQAYVFQQHASARTEQGLCFVFFSHCRAAAAKISARPQNGHFLRVARRFSFVVHHVHRRARSGRGVVGGTGGMRRECGFAWAAVRCVDGLWAGGQAGGLEWSAAPRQIDNSRLCVLQPGPPRGASSCVAYFLISPPQTTQPTTPWSPFCPLFWSASNVDPTFCLVVAWCAPSRLFFVNNDVSQF